MACAIKPAVREEVEQRDGYCCIFCGSPGRGEAHIVPRSHGGLGIPQNIITVCRFCHNELDNGLHTERYKRIAQEYIENIYPDWSVELVTFSKW